MIKITKTGDKFDQTPEEIIEQLKTNTDAVTEEFVEDIFAYCISPVYMKRFGYSLGDDRIYYKNEA